MTKTKFTPAPWQYTPCGPADSDGMGICAMWGSGKTLEANAHLIAAAPEMYEALEQFKDFAIRDGWQHVLIDSAETLLAKARGEK